MGTGAGVPIKFVVKLWIFCGIFGMYFTVSSTVYLAGSWCPYQVEKVVPCRVRNGTEPYYGTNICWRNENGSYACSKKLMYRPKYSTTYKKITETKYKCCLGRDGTECENECFNCSAFRLLEYGIANQEERLGRIEKSLQLHQEATKNAGFIASNDPFGFHRDLSSDNSVYSSSLPGAASPLAKDMEERVSLACATLSLRVHTILEDLREMQNRIRFLEGEVARLSSHVEDESISNNIAFDYSGGSSSSSFPENKDSGSTPHTTVSSKDVFTASTKSRVTSDDDTENRDNTSARSTLGETGRHFQEAHSHRHYHHHRHPHSRHHNEPSQNEEVTLPPHHHHHHHHHDSYSSSDKTEGPFRVLEENLERGDIASTLNDDYGDEDEDNSTEQYTDQLKGTLAGVTNANLSNIPAPLQILPYP